jgi:hypothetical protein
MGTLSNASSISGILQVLKRLECQSFFNKTGAIAQN